MDRWICVRTVPDDLGSARTILDIIISDLSAAYSHRSSSESRFKSGFLVGTACALALPWHCSFSGQLHLLAMQSRFGTLCACTATKVRLPPSYTPVPDTVGLETNIRQRKLPGEPEAPVRWMLQKLTTSYQVFGAGAVQEGRTACGELVSAVAERTQGGWVCSCYPH